MYVYVYEALYYYSALPIVTARLSQDDMERLLEEAGRHQREDSREKELILARNKLETFVQWLRYILRELLNKLHITANYRDDILSKCKEIDDWLKDNKVMRLVKGQ